LAVPDITLDGARSFLSDHFEGRAGSVEPLAGGDWSRAFAFRLGHRELVVRFGAWREDFEKDRTAMEFSGPDLPVPRVLEIGEALGGFYAVSERHVGQFLEELDADGFRRILPALFETLDAMRRLPSDPQLRQVPWDQWLLDVLVDRPGERVSGWRSRLAGSSLLDELFTAGHEVMEGLLPACPELHNVLHLDLLNRNVLVTDDASRLEAVFDWGCLASGDFVYEVAWFTFWAPWHPGLDAIDFRSSILDHYAEIGLEVDNFDERLACYELHIGLNHLAYNTFVPGREEDLVKIGNRLRRVL
jgi:aminoglycoside phosphotransferase (APT) family kinase protein